MRALRRTRRGPSFRHVSSSALSRAQRQARLGYEPLEDRRLLSVGSGEMELFRTAPATFIANEGQWADPAVRYAFLGEGANVLHTDAGPIIQLLCREDTAVGQAVPDDSSAARAVSDDADSLGRETVGPLDRDAVDSLVRHSLTYGDDAQSAVARSISLAVTFDGAASVTPVGREQAETIYNFFIGDPTNWREGVASYETVAYPDLFDGIDLLTFGQRDSLKYEFHVAPGADYRQIEISYAGSNGLSVDDQGRLHIATEFGDLVDDAPFVYQVIDGRQVEVEGQFALVDADTYTFVLSQDYDPTIELVIDPDLAWSTFLGGSGEEYGYGIAVDAAGNAYVTGYTSSSNFPATAGAADTTLGGDYDAFVAKLDASSSGLVYSTFLGGSGDESGLGIAVDAAGIAYMTGDTFSSNFPTTAGAADTTYNRYYDAFVAKLNPDSGLVYATFLGGSGDDIGYGIAVDAAGSAYVTGYTWSSNFRTTAGAADTTYNGGGDAFVAKIELAVPLPGDANDSGGVDQFDAQILAAHWGMSGMGWAEGDFNDDGLVNAADAAILAANWGRRTTPLIPGDANDNGHVDQTDAAILADHWGLSGMSWAEGDFNKDGVVNAADAAILAANWGRGASEAVKPQTPDGPVEPEPVPAVDSTVVGPVPMDRRDVARRRVEPGGRGEAAGGGLLDGPGFEPTGQEAAAAADAAMVEEFGPMAVERAVEQGVERLDVACLGFGRTVWDRTLARRHRPADNAASFMAQSFIDDTSGE